jgi:hypothetical protein
MNTLLPGHSDVTVTLPRPVATTLYWHTVAGADYTPTGAQLQEAADRLGEALGLVPPPTLGEAA